MKTNKLKKFETKIEPEITPEQHKANCERVAEMLLTVAEKMQNPAPVSETFDELMSQLKTGVKRSPVVVHHADGRRIRYDEGGNTEIISGGSEKMDENFITKNDLSDAEKMDGNFVTKYDSSELELLRKIDAKQ